jgi:hypothetical protein
MVINLLSFILSLVISTQPKGDELVWNNYKQFVLTNMDRVHLVCFDGLDPRPPVNSTPYLQHHGNWATTTGVLNWYPNENIDSITVTIVDLSREFWINWGPSDRPVGFAVFRVMPADLDRDEQITSMDFFLYCQVYLGTDFNDPNDLDADFNGDGRVNSNDFLGYLNAFFTP